MQIDIRDLAAQVLTSRTISRLEHQLVAAFVGRDDLDEQDRLLVERLSYGVRRGLVQVVD
mgnify:CR=1 FL=1|jgi:hypothetical protein